MPSITGLSAVYGAAALCLSAGPRGSISGQRGKVQGTTAGRGSIAAWQSHDGPRINSIRSSKVKGAYACKQLGGSSLQRRRRDSVRTNAAPALVHALESLPLHMPVEVIRRLAVALVPTSSVTQGILQGASIWFTTLCALSVALGALIYNLFAVLSQFVDIQNRVKGQQVVRQMLYGVDVTSSRFFKDERVLAAVRFAADAHSGQFRKTGEPYVSHCIETALIVEHNLPPRVEQERYINAIVTALLHDVIDDTSVELSAIQRAFGNKVSDMVAQVSKLSQMNQLLRRGKRKGWAEYPPEHFQALKKVIVDMVFEEPLVILVKLADRLHNMRTVYVLKPEKQRSVAEETRDVWCSMAESLGWDGMKSEMEDLCFVVLDSHKYCLLRFELDAFWKLSSATVIKHVVASQLTLTPMSSAVHSRDVLASLSDQSVVRAQPAASQQRDAGVGSGSSIGHGSSLPETASSSAERRSNASSLLLPSSFGLRDDAVLDSPGSGLARSDGLTTTSSSGGGSIDWASFSRALASLSKTWTLGSSTTTSSSSSAGGGKRSEGTAPTTVLLRRRALWELRKGVAAPPLSASAANAVAETAAAEAAAEAAAQVPQPPFMLSGSSSSSTLSSSSGSWGTAYSNASTSQAGASSMPTSLAVASTATATATRPRPMRLSPLLPDTVEAADQLSMDYIEEVDILDVLQPPAFLESRSMDSSQGLLSAGVPSPATSSASKGSSSSSSGSLPTGMLSGSQPQQVQSQQPEAQQQQPAWRLSALLLAQPLAPDAGMDAPVPQGPCMALPQPMTLSIQQGLLKEVLSTVVPFDAVCFKNLKGVASSTMRGLEVLDEAAALLYSEMMVRSQSAGLAVNIQGRLKSLNSVYRKMLRKNVPVSKVYDARALRVIVDDEGGSRMQDAVDACYRLVNAVHSIWKPIKREFDDYIANPKASGYSALHTAVVGPGGIPMEVQIKTSSMHELAEYGCAAHWVYKEYLPPPTAMSGIAATAATLKAGYVGQPLLKVSKDKLRYGVVVAADADASHLLTAVKLGATYATFPTRVPDYSFYRSMVAYVRERGWSVPGRGDLSLRLEEFTLCDDGRYHRMDHMGYILPAETITLLEGYEESTAACMAANGLYAASEPRALVPASATLATTTTTSGSKTSGSSSSSSSSSGSSLLIDGRHGSVADGQQSLALDASTANASTSIDLTAAGSGGVQYDPAGVVTHGSPQQDSAVDSASNGGETTSMSTDESGQHPSIIFSAEQLQSISYALDGAGKLDAGLSIAAAMASKSSNNGLAPLEGKRQTLSPAAAAAAAAEREREREAQSQINNVYQDRLRRQMQQTFLRTQQLRSMLDWGRSIERYAPPSSTSSDPAAGEISVLVWPGGKIEHFASGTTAGDVLASRGCIQTGEGRDGYRVHLLVNVNNKLVPEGTVLRDGDLVILSREKVNI